jgi:FlaA1/EpsC-like NDP-sugar epimerase
MKIIKLAQRLLYRHSWFVAFFQALLISFSLVLAWLLRFDFSLPYRKALLISLSILVVMRMIPIARFGLLHGWWKYTGLSDALDISKAVVLGSLAFVPTIYYGIGLKAFPRSVYVLEPLITAILLLGVRILSRILAESVRQDQASSKKVILIGAGIAAQTAVREMKRLNSGYTALGYVDDDRSKHGLKIHGVQVVGNVETLPDFIDQWPVDEVLIAVPSATGKQMQRFVEICERAKVKFRTMPALSDIISGRVRISEFRDVRVEDILGRDPVEIDMDAVKREIRDHVVVVTGAAGSIGFELCRQILDYGPSALLCIDQYETGMFYLERELRVRNSRIPIVACVADIGDSERVENLFKQYNPGVVFHAAAYKHVPVMEANVQTAVKNNVFGLLSFLDVVRQSGCQSFVLISSDKAVNPTSVMGSTKRIGELIIAAQPKTGLRCVSVRFGNVLFSSGSVVPVLQEQIRNNKPLTITHPDINRFFMTTSEAVSLVLQAFTIGEHGDTLVLDMGLPVRIVDLARTLIRLAGKTEQQIGIQFTGLREGEKLSEELFYTTEEVCSTSFAKIKKAVGAKKCPENLSTLLEELRSAMYVNGDATIREKIKEIVPEYLYGGSTSSQEALFLESSSQLASATGD